jgi:hypothetical protein
VINDDDVVAVDVVVASLPRSTCARFDRQKRTVLTR